MDVLNELKDHAAADDTLEARGEDRVSGRSRTQRRLLAMAAAASVAVLCGLAIYQAVLNRNQDFYGTYQTAVGGQKSIDLPDGSRVLLNTDSAAEIVFNADARVVRLTKGEGFFDVAHNKKRPFSVETSTGVVTAVGTAFSIRIDGDRIDVLVKNGRVALAAPAKPGPVTATRDREPPMEVSAGQSALFAQKVESIDIVEKAALEKKLDWQDGMLTFKGETLEQVVAELSRYTDTRIEITDPNLRHQKIVAYYRVGELEPMFQALRIMAGIRVERVDAHHVKLYR